MSYTISQNRFDGNFPSRPYSSVYVSDEGNSPMAILVVEGDILKEIHIVSSLCNIDTVIEAVKQSNNWRIERSFLVVYSC